MNIKNEQKKEKAIEIMQKLFKPKRSAVAPLAGARIEIVGSQKVGNNLFVAPLAGARIEM